MSLIYSMLISVDGYAEDEGGPFGWAAPDEEVHPLPLTRLKKWSSCRFSVSRTTI